MRGIRYEAGGVKGVFLEQLTWVEAEGLLNQQTIVLIPLGAAAKEHGPHLKLNNDWLIAEYLKQRVAERVDVVVAPTVPYHYYPAFIEYPGSITLGAETARDLVVDICRSLAAHGPRRFYVLNTGISTIGPLERAAEVLNEGGVVLHYTDTTKMLKATREVISEQQGGSHADEIETSVMLHIAPESVDMAKACKDYHPSPEGGLTRKRGGRGSYSPSGIYGDATLASREKGEAIVEALVAGILRDISRLRQQ